MIKLYPEGGERPEVDLSGVVFAEDYVIPRHDTIASSYQKGFEVEPDILTRWRNGESHAIAAEFVMHYYRSIGCGSSVQIEMTRPHHDDLLGVVVHAKDTSGEYFSYMVWPAAGVLCIER